MYYILGLKLFFIIGTLIKFRIRSPYQKLQSFKEIKFTRKLVFEKWRICLVKIGMLWLPALYIFTPILNFANYQLPISANVLGLTLYTIGLLVFYWSHQDLGNNWSFKLEIHNKHQLITHGIYEKIRHPMYTAIWLLTLAQPLILMNWIAGLWAITAFAWMYFKRVGKEEELMLQQFGKQYWLYMQRTGRLFPRVS